MTRKHARHDLVALVAIVLIAVGCSGSGSGCSTLTPLATRYAGPKTDNAINVQLSPEGVNYINANWQKLVSVFAPGNTLNVGVACMKQTGIAVLGTVYIADQGGSSGGRLDANCDSKDDPANVAVQINGFSLTPQSPDLVGVTLDLSIDTGKIYLTNPHSLCDLKCSLDFNTANSSPNNNKLDVTVKFSIDTRWDKLLAFEVQSLNGTQVCGASGAPAKPKCFDADDLNLSSEGGFCSLACDAADWAPVKDTVLKLISPLLQTQIKNLVAAQSCQKCGAGLPSCPTIGGAVSTCQSGVCTDTSNSKCVPRFLGVEGEVALGSVLGGFGVPASAKLDLSVAMGSSFSVDAQSALNIGTRAGLQAPQVAPCVPPAAAPPMLAVSAPDFRADAPPVTATTPPYHVGLGISQPFLDLAFHQAQQSGALCISLTSATVGLVNTGLFKTFLPSLGKLATRDGKDAPMMVVLRPGKPPTVKVGEGTFDPMTKKPIKPLLFLSLPELTIDIYAMIDERFARLFSITVDIGLPLSLIFKGCDSVEPALGDLNMLITNVRTSNAEMLAEDPKVLADLIPAVIGLAGPALSSALKPFALPALGAFKLQITATKGVGKIAGTENYNHLGLYARLVDANMACGVATPRTEASLKRSVMPKSEQMRLQGQPLPLPTAVLAVRALGVTGTAEYGYRIDQGLWSPFLAPTGVDELEISNPAFLMQGVHQIELRSRLAEDPHGVSPPVTVGFRVDWEAPELKFALDRAHDRLALVAHDVITPDEQLEYSYQLGDGAFSPFGPAREIIASVVEQQGGVTARVRDEMGNVGEISWRVPSVALRPDSPSATSRDPIASTGCASVPGFGVLALAALARLLRRRRP